MYKRGVGHIETILSIILFIAVVGVALTFFSPQRTDRLADNVLDYSFSEVSKNTSVEVLEVNVKMDYSDIPPEKCPGSLACGGGDKSRYIEVDLGLGARGFSRAINLEEMSVMGETLPKGAELDSQVDSSNPENIKIRVKTKGSESFKILVSEGVLEGDFGAGDSVGEGEQEEIGVIRKSEVVSILSLERLKERYEDEDNGGYEFIKEEFNLPNRIDFSFRYIPDVGSDEIGPGIEVPEGIETYKRSERVEVIDSEGEIKFGVLEVTVW